MKPTESQTTVAGFSSLRRMVSGTESEPRSLRDWLMRARSKAVMRNLLCRRPGAKYDRRRDRVIDIFTALKKLDETATKQSGDCSANEKGQR